MNASEAIAKFIPIQLTLSEELSSADKSMLEKIISACNIIDTLFLMQVYHGNLALTTYLKGEERALFDIHFGPFNRLENHKPFIPGHTKPQGANFYPPDMTKEEFEAHLAEHPDERRAFMSPYSIIQRRPGEGLVAVPYHEHFHSQVHAIHNYLVAASQLADNPSLKKFLELRAESFITDEYFESEKAWMDLDSDIDVAIGPYEVYEDELMGIKTSYEAIICRRLHAETQQLDKFKQSWSLLEGNLPVPCSGKRGTDTPLVVADMIYNAGEARAGVQAIAFNLPNDERVRQEKGSKQVLMKNLCHAKYDGILMPIVAETIHPDARQHLSFAGFFTHVLLHEISHGLGPGMVEHEGEHKTLQEMLQETYSTIEEAKAEVLGVHNAYVLADHGVITAELADQMAVGLVANTFRAIRFGITEAHGAADIIIFNRLKELGAVRWEDGYVNVALEQLREGYKNIAVELLEIQKDGDYQRARLLIDTYRTTDDLTERALEKIAHVPVDIRPSFPEL